MTCTLSSPTASLPNGLAVLFFAENFKQWG
jgi:hypothetical protein